ncbi:MAG: SMC-Scp complex subunit ScpB [Acidimicrobiaceae bacterium]|nr:SMC-Scp complex subunit ScpB [Acidimicrobiaceae bacterium]
MVAEHIPGAVEAILLVAEEPLPPELLAELVGSTPFEVEELCADLAEQYAAQGRGFTLKRVAGGYRFQTAAEQTPYVERYVLEGQSSRLSAAALETLAVVAYKQPVSRNQIAAIRGVNVDGVVRTLQVRGYIDEVARDPGPGQAVLYGTTGAFCERMGIDSVSELLPLGEFFPTSDVVEALERGLRVVPDDESLDDDDTPFSEAGDAEAT